MRDATRCRRPLTPAIGLSLVFLGCAASTADRPGSEDPAGRGDTIVPGLQVVVSTDAERYTAGTPILMTLAATNTTPETIELHFRSGQRFDFSVHASDGSAHWRWSDGRVFTASLGTEQVLPGETREWSASCDEELAAGGYRLAGTLTVDPEITVTTNFRVE